MALIKSCFIISRQLSLILLLFAAGFSAIAQSLTNSPYSKAGIGLVNEPTFVRNFSMGRMSFALDNGQQINPFNPASNAGIIWTTFETSVIGHNTFLTSGSQSQTHYITNFNHLALGFPVAKWWGASFGVMPMSKVGYDYLTNEVFLSENNLIPYQKVFSGAGGLNKVFLGHGFRIKQNLTIGFNFSYIFGDLEYQEVQQIQLSTNFLNSGSYNRIESGGIHFDFGAQYMWEMKNDWKTRFGLVFEPAQGLTSKQSDFTFTYTGSSGVARIVDSVSFSEKTAFSIDLPMKIGFGVMFLKSDRIRLGMEADYTNWSQMSFNSNGGLSDALNVRLGGEHRGDEKHLKKRFGMRYGILPVKPNGRIVREVAVSAGLGFPFKSKDKLMITELHIGAEAGRRGEDISPLFQEDFININISLTVNNKWFIKRKYD